MGESIWVLVSAPEKQSRCALVFLVSFSMFRWLGVEVWCLERIPICASRMCAEWCAGITECHSFQFTEFADDESVLGRMFMCPSTKKPAGHSTGG